MKRMTGVAVHHALRRGAINEAVEVADPRTGEVAGYFQPLGWTPAEAVAGIQAEVAKVRQITELARLGLLNDAVRWSKVAEHLSRLEVQITGTKPYGPLLSRSFTVTARQLAVAARDDLLEGGSRRTDELVDRLTQLPTDPVRRHQA